MKKKHRIKLLNIIFYSVSFLLLFYVFISFFLPEKSVQLLGFKSYVVVTPSMEPDIMVNDMVVVIKVNQEDLTIGQAISFYTYLPTYQQDLDGNTIYSRQVVTHYLGDIIELEDEIIYKTHKANAVPDTYDEWKDAKGEPYDLHYEDIIGRVSFTIPYIGVVLEVLRNPMMLLLILVNVGLVVVIIKVVKKLNVKGDPS